MRLATPDELLTGTGIQSGTGSLAVAGAALDATFGAAEERVESPLLLANRRDTFDLAASQVMNPSFRLEAAFVSKDEPVTVTINGTALADGEFFVQHDLGIVRTTGTFLKGSRVVSITYTAGFDKDNNTGALKALPDSLKQGGICLAVAHLLLHPANSPKDKARFLSEVSVHGMQFTANQHFQRHHRPRVNVIWAAGSEVLE